MAAKKFLRFVNGVFTEIFGVQTSAGASNAGDIPALDDSGRLDQSLMPIGIGADTRSSPHRKPWPQAHTSTCGTAAAPRRAMPTPPWRQAGPRFRARGGG